MIEEYLQSFSEVVRNESRKNGAIDSHFKMKLLFDKSVTLFYKKIKDKPFPLQTSIPSPPVSASPSLMLGIEEETETVTVTSVSTKKRRIM